MSRIEKSRMEKVDDTLRELDRVIEKLGYDNYIKAILKMEYKIEDIDLLDEMYRKYLENDYLLTNDGFDSTIEEYELEKEREQGR